MNRLWERSRTDKQTWARRITRTKICQLTSYIHNKCEYSIYTKYVYYAAMQGKFFYSIMWNSFFFSYSYLASGAHLIQRLSIQIIADMLSDKLSPFIHSLSFILFPPFICVYWKPTRNFALLSCWSKTRDKRKCDVGQSIGFA
jgi:hypothetical protein